MTSKVQSLMALAVLVGAGAGSSAFTPKHALTNTFQASKVSGVYHYYVVGSVPISLNCTITGDACTITTNLTLARLNNASPPVGQKNYTQIFPTTTEATYVSPGFIFK